MAKHIVEAMLPEHDAKIHKLSGCPESMRKKAVAQGKVMTVMLQEMCAFTKNAGDTFFAPSSIIQTPKLFFSAIIRQDRYAMGLERH
jgi:hypothetical protein